MISGLFLNSGILESPGFGAAQAPSLPARHARRSGPQQDRAVGSGFGFGFGLLGFGASGLWVKGFGL